VINPYTVHAHPYPTRFHGGIYTRPVFGLPYVRSPHAVFKPDDFYSYYGVEGLGGVGSLTNKGFGRNTLGLGATGTPIYYLASKSNPKVVSLQSGLNKVLSSYGYKELAVTGILDAKTCGALGLMYGRYPSDVLSSVDKETLDEAANTCQVARKTTAVNNQVIAFAQELEDTKKTVVVATTTAPSKDPQVVALQGALNKVLVAKGYPSIPVTGSLDVPTCASMFGLLNGPYAADLKSQVDATILANASAACTKSAQDPAVYQQMSAFISALESNKQNNTQVLAPQTEVVPATSAPVVTPPPTAPKPAPTTPPVSQPVPVMIAEPQPIELEEIAIEARPADQAYAKTNWMMIGLIAAGVVGAGYFVLKKK
jgi:hypothetical protein